MANNPDWGTFFAGFVFIVVSVAIFYFNYRTLRDSEPLSGYGITLGGAVLFVMGVVFLISSFYPVLRNELEIMARMLP